MMNANPRSLAPSPQSLAPYLKRWVQPGETLADGLRRADREVDRLRAERAMLLKTAAEAAGSEVIDG